MSADLALLGKIESNTGPLLSVFYSPQPRLSLAFSPRLVLPVHQTANEIQASRCGKLCGNKFNY